MERPAVLGGGSWGTALALVLARRGLPVTLWVHNLERAEEMAATRENRFYLPGFPIPDRIQIRTDIHDAVGDADFVIFAVPSYSVQEVALSCQPSLSPPTVLVSAVKGFQQNSFRRISEILEEFQTGVVALSGPSFAREVAAGLPTAVVAASENTANAFAVQRLFSDRNFRVYVSPDIRGVELGGAIKNVIAIAAGILHGMGLGGNALAALVTRGLAEISRLAVALGAQPTTMSGLAGLGDLVLTCQGELSRNRQVGIQLAQGKPLGEIVSERKNVAEGILAASIVVTLGHRNGVAMPISEQVLAILNGVRTPQQAVASLMERAPREE